MKDTGSFKRQLGYEFKLRSFWMTSLSVLAHAGEILICLYQGLFLEIPLFIFLISICLVYSQMCLLWFFIFLKDFFKSILTFNLIHKQLSNSMTNATWLPSQHSIFLVRLLKLPTIPTICTILQANYKSYVGI